MHLLAVLAAALALLLAPAGARAAEPEGAVDVALVLGVDSSSSVSMEEFYLQLAGYADAFRHPDVLEAVQSGPLRAVGIALFEWSGSAQQTVNFDWRRLHDAASLHRFADELESAPRLIVGGETAIGSAIAFGAALLGRCPFRAARQVLDISGDGASNRGPAAAAARDSAVMLGITINGLAILNEEPGLDEYYEAAVAGGDGAFVIAAADYESFAQAIRRKLVREIRNVAMAPRR